MDENTKQLLEEAIRESQRAAPPEAPIVDINSYATEDHDGDPIIKFEMVYPKDADEKLMAGKESERNREILRGFVRKNLKDHYAVFKFQYSQEAAG